MDLDEYSEFHLHIPKGDSDDRHPRIIMLTTDGYIIFGEYRQRQLKKLLQQIEREFECV